MNTAPSLKSHPAKFAAIFLACVIILQAVYPVPRASAQEIGTATPTETGTPEPSPTPTDLPTEIPTEAPSPTPLPTETPTEVPTGLPTEAPTEIPTSAPLELLLWATPDLLTPAGKITLRWEVIGLPGGELLDGYVLAISAPAGAFPEEGSPGEFDPVTGTLILPLTATQGSMHWQINSDQTAVFDAELLKNSEILATASVSLDPNPGVLMGPAGGSFNGMNGRVQVTVPVGALNEIAAFHVQEPGPDSQPAMSLTWTPVEIVAHGKANGQSIDHFNHPLTIQVGYDEETLPGWAEADLMLFYYNPADNDWYPIETTVDTESNTLTALSDHLTVFDYKAASWQGYTPPSVDSFQVASFTGAGTYSMGFWMPPGPGGMKPDLALTYNSQIIDGSSIYTQGSWVGMGWDLDTGAITRNMHGTNSDLTDDTFSIAAGGVSGLLLPIPGGPGGSVTAYKTADDSFAKILFNSSTNAWDVWTKDGTHYVFGGGPATGNPLVLKTHTTNGCVGTESNLNLPYRWQLVSVTNTNGQFLTYSYFEEKKTGCKNEIAVYPEFINYHDYPNNMYRVHFWRDAVRRTDYQNSWDDNSAKTLYGTYKLDRVSIEQNTGTWTSIRDYDFTYYGETESGRIYPQFAFSKGGHTLTLESVTEKNGTVLPDTTFAYGDSMHLTDVSNGYGGSVHIDYERETYFDDINKDLFNYRIDYGAGQDECYSGATNNHGWSKVSGPGYVRCDPTGFFQTGTNNTSSYTIAHRPLPEYINKPGGRFLFLIEARDLASPHSRLVKWGIANIAPSPDETVYVDDMAAELASYTGSSWKTMDGSVNEAATWDPTQVRLRLECAECYLKHFEFTRYPGVYRVSQRTLTDSVSGGSEAFTYNYDNGAPNSKDNSADVAAAQAAGDYSHLYTPALGESRGHGMTQAVDPNGLASVTWFHQGDQLKGRPYETLTLNESFFEGFDTPDNGLGYPSGQIDSDWVMTNGTHTADTLYQTDFDYAAKSTSTVDDWSVTLTRAAATLVNGDMAVAHVRLSTASGTPAGRVLLDSGGSQFGLSLPNSGSITTLTGAGLTPSVAMNLDEWYVVELFVDTTHGCRMRVWQENDPTNAGETTAACFGTDWTFRDSVNTGILWLDGYFEGTPYAASTTTYNAVTTHDTVAGGTYADIVGLTNWHDLRVYQVTTASTQSRLYDGDAAWDGTRATYDSYDSYGNLTHLTEFACPNSACSGTAYRATVIDYYQDLSKYVLRLPSRQETQDCTASTSECDQPLTAAEVRTDYDSNGNPSAARTWVGGANYSVVAYGYDSYGNPTSQNAYYAYYGATAVLPAPTSSNAEITTTQYIDGSYHTYATDVTNALSQSIHTDYNYALGLPTQVTDANGGITGASYDAFGRMTAVWAPYDNSTNPTLKVTYFDTASPFRVELFQRVDATKTFVVYRYYDGLARPHKVETGYMDPSTGPFTLASTVKYLYPSFAEQDISAPFGPGEPELYTISVSDPFGRPWTITAPDQRQTSYTYSGLTSTVLDPNGHSTSTTNDVWGRSVSVTPPTGPGVAYEYDVLGRLTKATRGGAQTLLSYDPAGRKVSMSDADMGNWSYGYDALGNLTRQTDARGQRICLYYDALNRPTGKHYRLDDSCPASLPPSPDVSYTYDQGTNPSGETQKGYRTGMTDASGSSGWLYDLRGRLLSETKNISAQNYATSWQYNSADLPTSMTYPDGETVDYEYNAQMLPTTVIGTSDYLTSTLYDSAQRMLNRTLGSGMVQAWTYYDWDEKATVDGQLVGQGGRLMGLTAGTLENFSYLYDAGGNIRQISDVVNSQTQTFLYDSLDRLTSASATGNASSGGYSETDTYNPTTGNLASKAGSNYTYGSSHAHAVTSAGSNVYTYDANGNMLTRYVSKKTITFTYDAEGHLMTASGTGLTASFVYNGDGQRVQQTINGVATTFVGGYYEKAGSTITKYYYAGGQRIAMRTGGTLYYLLSDHLGSTSITASSTGTYVAELRYKAWGEVRYANGTTPTKYQYTGQYSNVADFGLQYFYARWYDSSLGRFAQADSIIPGGVQGYDRYAYANNNPLKYNDPTGHCPEEDAQCRENLSWTLPLPTTEESVIRNYQDPFRGSGDYDYRNFGDYRGKWVYPPYGDIWHVSIDADCTDCFGEPIYPVLPGTVVEIGWGSSGFGNYIIVRHKINGQWIYSIYAHLGTTETDNGVYVEEGQTVDVNTPIGTLGNSTSGTQLEACPNGTLGCMGAHLHFEIRYEENVNLAEDVSLLYAKDYWAFNSSWKTKFFDLGLIYGYDENPSHPLPK